MGNPDRLEALRRRELDRLESNPRKQPLRSGSIVPVVGVSFATWPDGSPAYPENVEILDRAQFVALWRGEEPEPAHVTLVRQPDNPVDANAIEVRCQLGPDPRAVPLGHLPRAVAWRLAPELDDGVPWVAELVGVRTNPHHPDRPGVDVRLVRA